MDFLRRAFVITLPERFPQNFPEFAKRNEGTGIEFEMVAGVDGSKRTRAEAMAAGVIGPDSQGFTDGAISNAWSHRNVWQTTVSRRAPSLVFEDDAYIRRDLIQTLSAALQAISQWDIVMLGFNTDARIAIEVFGGTQGIVAYGPLYPSRAQLDEFVGKPEPITLRRLLASFGTCGYLITPAAAAVLMAHCFPLRHRGVRASGVGDFNARTVDIVMIAYYPRMFAYISFPPLVMTMNHQTTSTTANI